MIRKKSALKPMMLAALAGLMGSLAGSVIAQGPADTQSTGWEFRVCAPPNTMPFSHRDETGFENKIAEVLADEMGAELTYLWHPFNADLYNLEFAEGSCDVIIGVPDGTENTLNTISYYQSPYVHVYRADAGFDIGSMDDHVLQDLSIAVQGMATPPHEALLVRGLAGNVTNVFGGEVGQDHLASMVNAIAAGEADVGFGWGPVVAYYAERRDVDLVVGQVEPIFDLPSLFQFQPMTMAVRANDFAMQYRLNRAIAARWDDIQQILAEYNVPLIPVPAPVAGGGSADGSRTLRIGAVLPVPTGANTRVARTYDLIGEAARRGVLLAERLASQGFEPGSLEVTVVFGSSPNAAAARRAAEAMVTLNEIDVLLGGVGTDQAGILAEVAAEAGIPFINVGSTSLVLREQCLPTTFHVQPSAGTYIDAMVDVYGSADRPATWYLIAEDNAEAAALLGALERHLQTEGQELAGHQTVPKSRPVYFDILDEAEELGADTIMLALDPADQLALMGQAQDAGYDFTFAPFPDPLTQTREFLAASVRYGVALEVPRLQVWDPSLDGERAVDLSSRYAGQWGQPFDAPAWTAFLGTALLIEAARTADSTDATEIMNALQTVDAGAIGGKGEGLFFDESSHELPQNIYKVRINLENDWGIRLSDQLEAGLLEEVLEPGSLDFGEACQQQ